MNAERLLAHYEWIADAPDAIARLRRFILDLAVRGKLVPQGPKDGLTGLPSSVCDQPPDSFPSSWRYTRLVNLLAEDTRNGYSRRPDDAHDGTPILRISAGTVRRDGLVAEEEHKLISGISSEVRLQYGLRAGDLLACRFNGNKGFVGRLTIFNDYLGIRPIYPDKLIRVRAAPELMLPAYLRIAGDTDLVRTEVEEACATTVGNWGISATNLKEVRFPVPPLAEQHRIVAKIDELMALCDRLEAARTAREATRDRLASASLARLNAPDPETFHADARFALDALPALTTRPDQIKQLRQTILNLAVRGKLVPQDNGTPSKEVELESLAKIVRGSSPRPKGDPRYYGGPVPRLLIADITRDGKYVTPQLDALTIEGAKLSRPMPKGSLVLAISGSYGVPAFLAVDACIHDGFIGFRDVSRIVDPEYLYLVMQFRRPYFDDVVKDSGLKNLTTEHLKRLAVPLFPIDVQRRIIAKVDAVMALCDRLEASLAAAEDTRRRLLEALLADALAPAHATMEEAAE
jgi:type I restriction enzyme S subunit